MRLVITKTVDGIYRVYFDGISTFYGEGITQEAAVQDLVEKTLAVLKAIGTIQKGL